MRRLPYAREIVAGLAALAALLLMLPSSCAFAPPVDRKLHAAIGQALGREAVNLLGRDGGVIVITRDTAAFPQPALDVLLENFRREISRAGGKIVATRLIQLDPIRPAEVPPGDFLELIQHSSTGQVIVSLLGPPFLSEDQRRKLGQIKPRIVAFCSGNLAENLNFPSFFEAGLLHAALVSRPLSSLRADASHSSADRFEQLYRTVRAPDLAASRATSPSNP